MMYLYFENSRGIKRLITSGTEKECWMAKQGFLDGHNYKSYYTRVWEVEPGVRKLDVGSYTEFFYISDHELEI